MSVQSVSSGNNLPAVVRSESKEIKVIPKTELKQSDTFSKKGIDTHKVLIAGSTGLAGLEAGKKIGNKVSSLLENQLNEITADFCKTPSKLMPKKIMAAIKWGSGALCAYYAATLVLSDRDKDGQLDVFETVKELLDPR